MKKSLVDKNKMIWGEKQIRCPYSVIGLYNYLKSISQHTKSEYDVKFVIYYLFFNVQAN